MTQPSASLKRMLGRVFDSMRKEEKKTLSNEAYAEKRRDFVFHMTDWLQDLKDINDLYKHPAKYGSRDACIRFISILVHVLPHLNAAGRILLDHISDPFAKDYPVETSQTRNEKKSPSGKPKVSA